MNFFFNALMRKMNKRTRAGVGLNALNINVADGWRPTLPKEFYPGLIKLNWRCWDNDPAVRPNFDEIVGLLIGDVGHEIRSNEEPIFGSGRVIAEVDQRDTDLIDTGAEMVSRRIMEDILKEKDRELDILVMEHDKAISKVATEKEKLLKQLKAEHNLELKKKDKAINELKTTGRTERPKEDERLDSQVTKETSGLMSMLGRGAEVENAPERNTGRTNSTVQREASDVMSMLGR